MKDLSSIIDCIEQKRFVINRNYQPILKSLGLNTFESLWQYGGGKTIKEIKSRSVIRFEVQDQERKRCFYLKRHNMEFIGFRILLALFFFNRLGSQGRREFGNLCIFRKAGLATVTPVIAGERFVRFFWVESFIVTEDYHPYVSLEDIFKNHPELLMGPEGTPKRRALIKEISLLARRMHQKGFNHRDYNATHILVRYENESDTPKTALFDLQRVDRRKCARFRWMIKTLARVNYTLPDNLFNEDDRIHLLLNYKGKTEPNLVERFQWFFMKRKTARIKRHTEKIMAQKRKGKRFL